MGDHIGRSFEGSDLEDRCPCPQEACGLVDMDRVDPDCNQHPLPAARTIRQSHAPEQCPGPQGNHPWSPWP